jgi:hypothetical protein
MAYVHLRHTHENAGLPTIAAFDGVREALVSSAAGVLFVLLGAAAAALSLWLGAGRLLHRLTA